MLQLLQNQREMEEMKKSWQERLAEQESANKVRLKRFPWLPSPCAMRCLDALCVLYIHLSPCVSAKKSEMPGVKFALSDTYSSLRLLRSLNCLAWSSLWVTRAALYACFAGHTFDFWFDCGLKILYILWHSSRKCTNNLFIKRVITVSLKWAMFN